MASDIVKREGISDSFKAIWASYAANFWADIFLIRTTVLTNCVVVDVFLFEVSLYHVH